MSEQQSDPLKLLKTTGRFSEVLANLRKFAFGETLDSYPALLKELKNCRALSTLNLSSVLVDQIGAYLHQAELEPVEYYVNGGHNLIFSSPNDLLIKLNSSEVPVTNSAINEMILQPLVSHDFQARMHEVSMEVVPRLNTQDVTIDHVNALGIALAKKGYVLWDNEIHNVGLLPDGTPVLIDAGAVISVHNCTNEDYLKKYEFWKVMETPEYSWEGKQERYFAELRKSFAGKVDMDDLRATRRARIDRFMEWPASCGM